MVTGSCIVSLDAQDLASISLSKRWDRNFFSFASRFFARLKQTFSLKLDVVEIFTCRVLIFQARKMTWFPIIIPCITCINFSFSRPTTLCQKINLIKNSCSTYICTYYTCICHNDCLRLILGNRIHAHAHCRRCQFVASIVWTVSTAL